MAERSYRPLVWPARFPRGKNITQYEGLLAPELQVDIDEGVEEWTPTDDRFTDEDLLEREASIMQQLHVAISTTQVYQMEKFPLKMADLLQQRQS